MRRRATAAPRNTTQATPRSSTPTMITATTWATVLSSAATAALCRRLRAVEANAPPTTNRGTPSALRLKPGVSRCIWMRARVNINLAGSSSLALASRRPYRCSIFCATELWWDRIMNWATCWARNEAMGLSGPRPRTRTDLPPLRSSTSRPRTAKRWASGKRSG